MIENNVKGIVIIGASGHGKVVADIARLNGYQEIIFLDDDSNKKKCGLYKIVGTSNDVSKYNEKYDFFVAIGNNEIREKIASKLNNLEIDLVSLIHPNAIIDSTASIDLGTVIMANVVINTEVKIGKGCIINTAATVDHDCFVGDYVHISPGAHIAGTVEIGKSSWIGIGVSVINNVAICKQCVIGAGSVVVENLIESGTYIGAPAKRIK